VNVDKARGANKNKPMVVDEITGNGMNNFRNITIYCRGNCLIKEPNDKN
jgi:hypothetical protein